MEIDIDDFLSLVHRPPLIYSSFRISTRLKSGGVKLGPYFLASRIAKRERGRGKGARKGGKGAREGGKGARKGEKGARKGGTLECFFRF